MTEVDAALVRRKLAVISRNLDDLAEVEGLELEDYREDRFRQKGTERLLQETVEAAVDANTHILRALGETVPADYFQSFVEVGHAGVIPSELAERLAPSAGLRNRLVHEYEEIDDRIVLDAVKEAREGLGDYVARVEAWLSGQGV